MSGQLDSVLFTSSDWRIGETFQRGSCGSISVTGPTEEVLEFSIESATGANYRASLNFTFPIAASHHDWLNEWITTIQEWRRRRGIADIQPLPRQQFVPFAISLEIASDPSAGHFRANGAGRLADSIETTVAVGGLNGSVEAIAAGNSSPLFLAADVPLKVEQLSLSRDPRDGHFEATALYRTGSEPAQRGAEGIVLPRLGAPPCGGVSVPLRFPSGLLVIPASANYNQIVALGNDMQRSFDTGILIALAAIPLAVDGKYKCVRHICQLLGATILCTAGMAVLTAGGPALAAAAIACFGAKAFTVIDMVLAHMGWE